MLLSELSSIGTSDLPIAGLKDHLRLGSGFAEDDLQDGLLETFLRASIATIEGKTGAILISRRFALDITKWRDSAVQVFPIRPISSLDIIEDQDVSGARTTLEPELFHLEPDTLTPKLHAMGTCFPKIVKGHTVSITFNAGFGPSWDHVPSDLRQAVLVLAAHFYENRSGAFDAATPLPQAVQSMIERHRPMRLFKGI